MSPNRIQEYVLSPKTQWNKQVFSLFAVVTLVLISGAGDLAAQSSRARALLERSNKEYRDGRLKDALGSIQSAKKIDPYLVSTYQMEAQILFDLGDKKGFQEALVSTLAANPQSSSVHNAVGKLFIQFGEIGEGVRALERAVALSPHKPQYAKDLAATYFSQKRKKTAIKTLTEAVRRNPKEASLPIALAQIHESVEDWNHAVYFYRRAVRDDRGNGFCRRQLARCLYQSEQYSEAIKLYAECQKKKDIQLMITDLTQYGDCCLRTEKYELAQSIFDHIADKGRRPSRDLELLRGLCALKLGERKQAEKIVTAALKHWPGDSNLSIILTHCTTEAKAKPSSDKTGASEARKIQIKPGVARKLPAANKAEKPSGEVPQKEISSETSSD